MTVFGSDIGTLLCRRRGEIALRSGWRLASPSLAPDKLWLVDRVAWIHLRASSAVCEIECFYRRGKRGFLGGEGVYFFELKEGEKKKHPPSFLLANEGFLGGGAA